MAEQTKDWSTAPLDIDWVVNSGLLFHINHTILHLLGVALTVRVDAKGNKSWGFKDNRANPEELVFDKNQIAISKPKLEDFLASYGHSQMSRREKKLGWACQPISQIPEVAKK